MRDDGWLYALGLASVASGVAGLLVPLYLVRIGAGAPALGASAAVASIVSAPGGVFAGRYADRTGNRRGVVLVALVVVAVALAVVPVLRSIPAVIAVNAVQGFALGAVAPVVTTLAVADVSEDQWNGRIARLNTFQGYGAMAGLILGVAWTGTVSTVTSPGLAQRSLFAFAALVGAASAVLAGRTLPRVSGLDVGPRRSGRVASMVAGTNRRTRDATFAFGSNRIYWGLRSISLERLEDLRRSLPRALWLYFAAAFVFFTGFAAFWAPLPLYLTGAGFASGPVFGFYLVNNLASTALFEWAGRVSARYDVRIVQSGALGVRALAFAGVGVLAVLGVSTDTPAVALLSIAGALLLVGTTWAVIAVAGTAIVTRSAPARSRGAVLGIYAALSAVGGGVGSLLGGAVAAVSFPGAFGLAGAFVIAGSALVIVAKRRSTPEPETARPASEGDVASPPGG